MKGRQSRKRGFTLIEMVVTVGIITTLAAVVVPQVVKQFDSADPARLQNDLKNLQAAIEIFNVNVKGLPGDLDDLVNPIATNATFADAVDSSFFGSAPAQYTDAQVLAWAGPYVDFSILQTDAGAELVTGFGGNIQDNFGCYNASTNAPGVALNGYPCLTPGGTDRLFLAIRIEDLSVPQFTQLNELFDGATETPNEATLGRVRRVGTTVYYLATPLN